jgi:predicted O-linked N-acetylglucosamine transferase (SPINDLY family)
VNWPGSPLRSSSRIAPEQAFQQAVALHDQGRLREAERLYHAVLKSNRDHFATLCRLGLVHLQCSKLKDAVPLFRRALKLDPQSADALQYLGSALTGMGRCEEAVECYQNALAVRPDFPEAHNNLGHTLQTLARFNEAILEFEKAVALKPDYAEARNNLGNVLHVLDRSQEAIAHYEMAIATRPGYAEAYWNLGNALRAVNRAEAAIARYEMALAIKPDYAEANNSLGNTLRILGRHEEAIAQYETAIAKRRNYVDAHLNLGQVLTEFGRHEAAIAQYDNVLAIDRRNAAALGGRGRALAALKRHPEAVASFEKALRLDANHPYALEGLVRSAAEACDWSTTTRRIPELIARAASGALVDPLDPLTISDDPALHRASAESFVRHTFPSRPTPLWTGATWRNRKIRLGYVASGFHEHPTAFLTAELIEIHDRSQFEVLGFAIGPDDRSDIRARLKRAFDQFHDVRPQTDEEVAHLINDMQLDIVIDRSGYTANSRPAIFAHRPAPIQVNYIGYPGTLGADFYDYVIADHTVLPFDQQPFFAEKIVHLPESYLVNDTKRLTPVDGITREQAGLPAHGFVFCCFNLTSKITPQMFDVWMRLLRQTEGSVLWLLRSHPATVTNLAREATTRGVDPARLVYADRMPLAQHLARHCLADLFLDTLPYNAHTTANDALLAGLPVVTCLGKAFAGRIAASLLVAIGLPELVTHSLEEYEALALRLATEPALLGKFRDRLQQNKRTYPLFNGDCYRRQIEAAYMTMWELWQRGDKPRNFAIAAGDPPQSSFPQQMED